MLSGRSQVVGGDPYEIYLTEPAGWNLTGIECGTAQPLPTESRDGTVRTGCLTPANTELAWRARFTKRREELK